MSNVVTLNREELYELVWSTPMMKLAKKYCLSDQGLAKTCKRMEIPIPWRGYWAKVSAGHKVARTALPPASDKCDRSVGLELRPEAKSEDPIEPELLQLDPPEKDHPLVEQMRQALAKQKITADEPFLINRRTAYLRVQVTPTSLDRALEIMNTLVVNLEARSHVISNVATDAEPLTHVSVDQEQVSIYLKERLSFQEEAGKTVSFPQPIVT